MGRFYSTDKPTFEKDFIYEPPYQLINSALEANQKGFDTAVNNASLLSDIDFRFIDDEATRQEAKRIADMYSGRTDAITQSMAENPTDWRKFSLELNNVKNQLSKDFQTGDIYRLQKNAEIHDKVKTQLAALDPTIKDAAYNQLMENYRQQGREKGINKAVFEDKSFLNRKDLNQLFADLVVKNAGNFSDTESQDLINQMTKDGVSAVPGYIRRLSSISTDNAKQLQSLAQGFITEPGLQQYMKQMDDLNLEKYYERNPDNTLGEFINPFNEDGTVNEDKARKSSLSGLVLGIMPGLQKRTTSTADEFISDNTWLQNRAFNYQKQRDDLLITTSNEERAGGLDLATTDAAVSQELNDKIYDILEDPTINKFMMVQRDKQGKVAGTWSLKQEVDKNDNILDQTAKTADILRRALKSREAQVLKQNKKPENDALYNYTQNKLNELITLADKKEKTTQQSWTLSPSYAKKDNLALEKEKIGLNNVFKVNGSDLELQIPITNVTGGATKLQKDLNNRRITNSGIPVGKEITYTSADGNPVKTGHYSSYRPTLNQIGWDTQNNKLILVTNKKEQARSVAVRLVPNKSQAVIPASKEWVYSKETRTNTPIWGVGVMDVIIDGYVDDGKAINLNTTPLTTIQTKFKTQGGNSGSASSTNSKYHGTRTGK